MKSTRSLRYMAVYDKLKEQITSGVYPMGSKLPSKRTFADMFGVSIMTVVHALEMLADEGFIVTRERSGYYVIYQGENSRHATYQAPKIDSYEGRLIAMESGFPISVYAKSARHVLSEQGDRVLLPSDDNGLLCLREAIADYLARARDIRVEPSQIFVGSGARSLYYFTVLLCGRDKRYAIEDPSYDRIESTYRALGIEPIKASLGKNGIDGGVLSVLDADLLHVTPYYSYPSGISTSAAKRREYTEWAQVGDRMLIEDDFGSELCRSGRPSSTLFSASPERVIYINSFSKTISPAIRAGYAVVPKELVPAALAACEIAPCNLPTLDQYLLAELISSGNLERHINRIRRRLKSQE